MGALPLKAFIQQGRSLIDSTHQAEPGASGVWQMRGETRLPRLQQRMMKFVAQKIKSDLRFNHPLALEHFKVTRKDRHYQFFKERPLSISLYREEVMWQKIEYIHRNPVQPKWRLAAAPEEYLFSSAAFYSEQSRQWPFLTHVWYGDDWVASP